jgi:DNA-binding transcriptional MerR regulator
MIKSFIPTKLYYKIREVCEIAGVEAHVLRFWETEFPTLSPPKSRKGQRIYRPKDIELILEIRKLLYEEGYTIAGARKRMGMRASAADAQKKQEAKEDSQPCVSAAEPVKPVHRESLPLFDLVPDEAGDQQQTSERLKRVQMELENILTLLDRE